MKDCTPVVSAAGPVAPGAGRAGASRAGGFTLIEVLLALVLMAALLTAINQFVFSITEVWAKNQDDFLFVQHSRAVAQHLGEMLLSSAQHARAGADGSGPPRVAPMKLPDGGTADLLTFDLSAGDRLFTWPGRPLPEVQCALAWRKTEGLVLYWKSRLETDFATANPRLTVISRLVTSLTYDYYDGANDEWTSTEVPLIDATGALLVPRRIRLHFHRKQQDYEEIVVVPELKEGLPAY